MVSAYDPLTLIPSDFDKHNGIVLKSKQQNDGRPASCVLDRWTIGEYHTLYEAENGSPHHAIMLLLLLPLALLSTAQTHGAITKIDWTLLNPT
jgi:hypothetical protein